MSDPVKLGYKTTEFWLSTVAMLIGALMASGALDSLDESNWIVRVVGGAVAVLSALGYEASRSKVKENADAKTNTGSTDADNQDAG